MIEDDEGHARLIEKNIRRAGVNNEIMPFANGTDAMEYLFGADGSARRAQGQALLILLDLNLPDMSGIDILKSIKENEHLKRTPVVVLTTTDDSGNPALLRPRLQRLHHQAGQLRELRQRDPPARPVLLRDPGPADRRMTDDDADHVLYIDDDPASRRLVERGLRAQGLCVMHAAGGEDGLARLAQGRHRRDRARP